MRQRPDIETRNLTFELPDDMPHHWHGGDPYVTHFFNGLSLMFPDGEKFFVDAVRRYQDRITDPKLRDEVRAFCGQEGIHAREHRRMNEMLERQGYPSSKIERLVRRLIGFDRQLPPKVQLAMTCALEHFTAIFADIVLRDPRMFERAHPAMQRLWSWHAVEETEHKSVAFDVYQTVAPGLGGYLRRVGVMAWVTLGFLFQIMLHQAMLVHHDGMFWKLRARREAFRFFFVSPGFLPKGMRHYLRYYRRDFHPWEVRNGDLVERWKNGAAGAVA